MAKDKYACLQCITDLYIRGQLEGEEVSETCDYCGRESDKPIAVELDRLIEIVRSAVESEFCDPAEELPYESAEGGYQGSLIEHYDLLEHLDEFTEDDTLRSDVSDAFTDQAWCDRDYFATKTDDALKTAWIEFQDIIKHRSRFFFRDQRDDDSYLGAGDISAADFLDGLASAVRKLDLVQPLLQSTLLYRVRDHPRTERPSDAASLGSPPHKKVQIPANRMSPAGISMFYGALDTDTAAAEILATAPEAHTTTGVWHPSRDLRVLDLRGVDIPSIYDEERRSLRRYAFFLRDFVRAVSCPVRRDGKNEHIEYTPTQAITEYFRYVFREFPAHGPFAELDEGPLDGIVYQSAVKSKGHCVVLFVDSESCVDELPDRVSERRSKSKRKALYLVLKEVVRE